MILQSLFKMQQKFGAETANMQRLTHTKNYLLKSNDLQEKKCANIIL